MKCIVSKYRMGMRLCGLMMVLGMASVGYAASPYEDIAQTPLFLENIDVTGNLFLVPSVEWPTINSVANIDSEYSHTKVFVGYFDSGKCYTYQFDADQTQRHFTPSSLTSNATCTGTGEWSGNFLNWVATQTVDPFRKALTGGYRVKDTPTETWLEKARHTGQGGTDIYPNREINDSGIISDATPFTADRIKFRIEGLGNQMRLRLDGDDVNEDVQPYNPGDVAATDWRDRAYEVSIRVSVCVPSDPSDPSFGVESNCVQYNDGWKPEGLLQANAESIRYSVMSYLNDESVLRDGGVLRARKKFVGPLMPKLGEGLVSNPKAEWNPDTGVLVKNPDPADVEATNTEFSISIEDSGVINYINQFGQLTENLHKSKDPVSELYYAMTRYVRNIGNVPEYSAMQAGEVRKAEREQFADGFPVITDWEDPMQYMCQPNVALGIGDVYTHLDKNLPGSPYTNGEPAKPASVTADTWANVVDATNRVGALEGLGNIGSTDNWSGRDNSAYIAGLAYLANTTDMRPDDMGKQTLSTYWVDVLENQTLEGPARNPFYLATKYGGFSVPRDFTPYDTSITSLEESWWHNNGEQLTYGSGDSFKRPDNFFTAGRAADMVEGLERAFDSIIAELQSNVAAVAVNSSRLDTDTVLYQAGFDSSRWSGVLEAYSIFDTREPIWQASDTLNEISPPARNILTYDPVANGGRNFTVDNLNTAQALALSYNTNDVLDAESLVNDRVAWLRGASVSGFRSRADINGVVNVLGDIVNSDPQFVGKPNQGYILLPAGAESSYSEFRGRDSYRNRADAVYVGSNDGKLYAFNAETGAEMFSYVPAELLKPEVGRNHSPLNRLMDQDYNHRFMVDGTPTIRDAFIKSDWRTVLVGTMGVGGRAVFALDVTNPSSVDAGDVLWEISNETDGFENLGYGVTDASIVRLEDGRWAAIFGNGYGGDNNQSSLFVVDLTDGSLITELTTDAGNADQPNAMAAPFVTDWPNGRRVATRAYAGDLLGNMWRVDLKGPQEEWTISKLFQALDEDNDPQPIVSQAVGFPHPELDDTLIISFGTGSYFRFSDANDNQVQTLYGIYDTGTEAIDPNNLAEQSIIFQQAVTVTDGDGVDIDYGSLRATTNEPQGPQGWRLDLKFDETNEGERVVSRPSIITSPGRYGVRFTTLIPDIDPCGTGRYGYVMELDIRSGARPDRPVFDLDRDGVFDETDMVDVEIDGEMVRVPVSGVGGVTQGESLTTVQGEGSVEEIVRPVNQDGDDEPAPGLLGDSRVFSRQSWELLR